MAEQDGIPIQYADADGAVTQEIWLVRNAVRGRHDSQGPFDQLTRAERTSLESFEWIPGPRYPLARSYGYTPSPSPVDAAIATRLGKARARDAEVQVDVSEEMLRALKVANRREEEASADRDRDASRKRFVTYVRSIVLLLFLVWTLIYVSLSMANGRVTKDIVQAPAIRYLSKLLGARLGTPPPPALPGGPVRLGVQRRPRLSHPHTVHRGGQVVRPSDSLG
jgi:hypothetical protein